MFIENFFVLNVIFHELRKKRALFLYSSCFWVVRWHSRIIPDMCVAVWISFMFDVTEALNFLIDIGVYYHEQLKTIISVKISGRDLHSISTWRYIMREWMMQEFGDEIDSSVLPLSLCFCNRNISVFGVICV